MKKWLLGIFIVGLIVFIGFVIAKWQMIDLFMNAGKIYGTQQAIPAVSKEINHLQKGEADWIAWRGARGDGRSDVTGIRKDWSTGLRKVWKVNYLCQDNSTAVWSAPVIRGNRLIACGRDLDNDLVFCLDSQTGTLLWQAAYQAKADKSWGLGARATPYIDNKRVYTFGRSGDLCCWRLQDGQKLWQQKVDKEGGKAPRWGHASSPLVIDNVVVVQGGGAARTIGFDKLTGKVAWKVGNGVAGYAAIGFMELAGQKLVLSFHGQGLSAIIPKSGKVSWTVKWETPHHVNATSPIWEGNNIFITSGYKTGCALITADANKAEIVWRNKNLASHHSDPIIIDGYIYGYSGQSSQNRGVFKCIEWKTGTEKWSSKKMGWGTLVFVDEHLLCQDIKGNIFLMKPDPQKFIKLTEMRQALGEIKGPAWTTPVIANGKLYLRFKQHLICYDLINKS